MSKTKANLSEHGCVRCGLLYPADRAKYFEYCKPCAESQGWGAPKQFPIIEQHKQAAAVCSHESAFETAKQFNPKRWEK
jgi:hypothetical protein